MMLRASGSAHDGRPHKIAKNWPLSLIRTGSNLLSVRTHYKFGKILCFLRQKMRTSAFDYLCLHWTTLPLTADVFYGQPLTMNTVFLESKQMTDRHKH